MQDQRPGDRSGPRFLEYRRLATVCCTCARGVWRGACFVWWRLAGGDPGGYLSGLGGFARYANRWAVLGGQRGAVGRQRATGLPTASLMLRPTGLPTISLMLRPTGLPTISL